MMRMPGRCPGSWWLSGVDGALVLGETAIFDLGHPFLDDEEASKMSIIMKLSA